MSYGLLQRSVDESLLFVVAVFLSTETLLIVHQLRNADGDNAFRASARNVLIRGSGLRARALAAQIAEHPERGRRFRGFLDDVSAPSFGVLGSAKELATI